MPHLMVQAPGSASVRTSTAPSTGATWSWRRWLLLGVCGGLAFGITHRLLSLQLEVPWRNTQPFGVRATPGTSLDTLRQRFGGDAKAIRADLDLIELERQRQDQEAADANRLDKLEEQDRLDRERQQRELNQATEDIPLPEPAPEPQATTPEPAPAEPAPLPPLQPLQPLPPAPSQP